MKALRLFRSLSSAGGVLSGVLFPASAWAQAAPPASQTIAVGDWQLSPELSVRSRGEYWRDPVDVGGANAAGQMTPRVRDAGGALLRSRLGLGAENGGLKAQVTLQDARLWGDPRPTGMLDSRGSFASFGAQQAYVEAHTTGARMSFVRIGRQAVEWGDGSLLGVSDWSPTGRQLDAIRGHLALGVFELDALASILEAPQPFGFTAGDPSGPSRSGVQLYGLSGVWSVDPLLKAQASALTRISRTAGGEGPRSLSLAASNGETYTASLRVYGDDSDWAYSVEGAFQFGNAPALGADVSRQAYAAKARVSRSFDTVLLTPTFRMGGSYATGDEGGNTYRQFDPLLPDPRRFFGAMDLFTWSNVIEGNGSVTIVPWIDTTFALEYRYAVLEDGAGDWVNGYGMRVGPGPRSSERGLGHELDAVFTWNPWPALSVSAAYAMFMAEDGARSILAAQGRGDLQPNGTFSPVGITHFGYMQATVKVP